MTNVQHASEKMKGRPKKRSSPKFEAFLSSKSREDQKISQRTPSAQTQTIIKLLGWIQSNYWVDVSPHTPGIPALLIGRMSTPINGRVGNVSATETVDSGSNPG